MLNPESVQKVLAENLTALRQWLEGKHVTEISVNSGGKVFVEEAGVITGYGALLSDLQIDMALTAVAKLLNKDSRANTLGAIVNASVGDLRIAGAKAPISPDGSFLTIRKHKDKDERPTLDDLIHRFHALTVDQADKLIDLVINQRRNCIVAGGTGSGKTTLLNALLSRIPPHERIVTIEDAPEIELKVPNLVRLVTNETANITARDLVKLAMRLRPDRLILGETRGDETYDVIRAFNSGHPGSVSTVHADSAYQALSALEMLFQMSLPPNASMPPHLVRQFVADSVNVVVYAGKRTALLDGKETVVRRIEQICLVKGVKDGNFVLEEV
jgi:pilus assembly protein CpaF